MRSQCCGVIYTGGGNPQRCPDCPGFSQTLPFFTAPNTGWICPRCNVVNAPTITQCHCHSMLNGPMLGGVGLKGSAE